MCMSARVWDRALGEGLAECLQRSHRVGDDHRRILQSSLQRSLLLGYLERPWSRHFYYGYRGGNVTVIDCDRFQVRAVSSEALCE